MNTHTQNTHTHTHTHTRTCVRLMKVAHTSCGVFFKLVGEHESRVRESENDLSLVG